LWGAFFLLQQVYDMVNEGRKEEDNVNFPDQVGRISVLLDEVN
jgi:hypothetical protein